MSENEPENNGEPENTEHSSLPKSLELTTPRSVAVGRGVGWIVDGFGYFQSAPSSWLAIVGIGLAILLVSASLGTGGQLLLNITQYIWAGGLMLGCKAIYEGRPFVVSYLFEGFKQGQIVKYLILALVASVLSGVIQVLVFGDMSEAFSKASQQSPEALSQLIATEEFRIKFLMLMLAMIPLFMATLFAPVLIAVHRVSVLQAVYLSFMACLHNALPLIIYSGIMIALFILSVIPAFIGLLIFVPVAYASVFCAYKDIFTKPHAVFDHMEV
ncbi:BPSS1780 family membrane protein [Pleionea sediminis]|uniref:BPSS1780 family membrane protein n=1 Tax=Pleionea sediminis TaxID=2569479 RepID=UPI001184D6D6|nr:BPSS1780 family membrane protein [Pleionea sediminis]